MNLTEKERILGQYKKCFVDVEGSSQAQDPGVKAAVTSIRALTPKQLLDPAVIGAILDGITRIPATEKELQQVAVGAVNTLAVAAHDGNRDNYLSNISQQINEAAADSTSATDPGPDPGCGDKTTVSKLSNGQEVKIGQIVLVPLLEYLRALKSKNHTSAKVIPTAKDLAYQKDYPGLVVDITSESVIVHIFESRQGEGLSAIAKDRLHEWVPVFPEGFAYQSLVPQGVDVFFTRGRRYWKGSMLRLRRTEFPLTVAIEVVPGRLTEESMLRFLRLVEAKQKMERATIHLHLSQDHGIAAHQQLQLLSLGQPKDNEMCVFNKDKDKWEMKRVPAGPKADATTPSVPTSQGSTATLEVDHTHSAPVACQNNGQDCDGPMAGIITTTSALDSNQAMAQPNAAPPTFLGGLFTTLSTLLGAGGGPDIAPRPPVPYKKTTEGTMHLCKNGRNCLGRWSEYNSDGKFIGQRAPQTRFGDPDASKSILERLRTETSRSEKAKEDHMCCDCFAAQINGGPAATLATGSTDLATNSHQASPEDAAEFANEQGSVMSEKQHATDTDERKRRRVSDTEDDGSYSRPRKLAKKDGERHQGHGSRADVNTAGIGERSQGNNSHTGYLDQGTEIMSTTIASGGRSNLRYDLTSDTSYATSAQHDLRGRSTLTQRRPQKPYAARRHGGWHRR